MLLPRWLDFGVEYSFLVASKSLSDEGSSSSSASALSTSRRHAGAAPTSRAMQQLRGFCNGTKSPLPRKVRVVCVGDSITFGNGAHKHDARKAKPGGNWPIMLEQLLTLRHLQNRVAPQDVTIDVRNFGVNGATASSTLGGNLRKYSYVVHAEWRRALEASNAEPGTLVVAVLFLGTNDCKNAVWNRSKFERDYLHLIRSLAERASLVVAVTPPVIAPHSQASDRWDFSPSTLRDEVAPAIRRVAAAQRVPIIDLTESSARWPCPSSDDVAHRAEDSAVDAQDGNDEGTNARELRDRKRDSAAFPNCLFRDGVHPARHTHDRIAAEIADALCAL